MFSKMHLGVGACIFTLLLTSALAGKLKLPPPRILIANGNNTRPADVPWHVTIYKPESDSFNLVCGGTLVSPTFVITAAHCFDDETPRSVGRWKVAMGNYKTRWEDHESSTTQQINVKRHIAHSAYRSSSNLFEHDIALLELTSAARMTDTVQIAHIDLDNRLPPDTGKVAGRGLTEHGTASTVLQSIELPYVDRHICDNLLQSLYSKSPNNAHLVDALTSDRYCAGFQNQNRSVCNGDSGGGYITFDPDTRQPFVRGVVSVNFSPADYDANVNGCFSHLYTAFTNVTDTRYIPWITQQAPSILESTPCEPVTSSLNDRNYFCNLDAQAVECSLPMIRRTVAAVSCKPGFVQNANSGGKMYAKCLSNGRWSETLATCISAGTTAGTAQPTAPTRPPHGKPPVVCSFQCQSGHCIPAHQRCNGFRDCRSGEDEDNCVQPDHQQPTASPTRPPHGKPPVDCSFQCQSGHCIGAHQRCNGFRDCLSGEDEHNCVQPDHQEPAGNSPGNQDSYTDDNGCHVQVTRYSKNGGVETKTRTTCQKPGGGSSWHEKTEWSSGGRQIVQGPSQGVQRFRGTSGGLQSFQTSRDSQWAFEQSHDARHSSHWTVEG